MKKFLSLILALAMALSLVACGGNDAAEEETPAEDTAVEETVEEPLKVALVVNQPFGDKGSMDDLAAGADRAAADFGVEVYKLESDTATFEDDIRAMCQQGYDLIVTTYPYMQDATVTVAQEYPDVQFCAVFQQINTEEVSYPNIWDIEFHGEHAFYVAGYMAGLHTKTGVVGFQCGGDEPSPNAEANGFMKGALDANPDVTCEFAYAGGYGDPATAKEKALAMIANGCDFIQNDSGASNAGVVEAAKENGILTAGEITDYWDTYEGFIGIIGIHFGAVAYDAIEALVNGNYPGGQRSIYGLAEGGYTMEWDTYERYAEVDPDFAAVVEAGKEIEAKVIAGEITVDYNTDLPTWDAIKNAG